MIAVMSSFFCVSRSPGVEALSFIAFNYGRKSVCVICDGLHHRLCRLLWYTGVQVEAMDQNCACPTRLRRPASPFTEFPTKTKITPSNTDASGFLGMTIKPGSMTHKVLNHPLGIDCKCTVTNYQPVLVWISLSDCSNC